MKLLAGQVLLHDTGTLCLCVTSGDTRTPDGELYSHEASENYNAAPVVLFLDDRLEPHGRVRHCWLTNWTLIADEEGQA